MEIVRSIDSPELARTSKANRRALGLITHTLIRLLGSPERLTMASEVTHDAATIMSSLNPEPLTDTTLPAFNAQIVDGQYMVTARLLGVHRRRFPITLDIAYQLQKPQFTSSRHNLLPIANVTETTVTCWPDHLRKLELPDASEFGGDFATRLAATALRRLHQSDLPDTTTWHTVHTIE